MSSEIRSESDRYTKAVAETVRDAFTNPDRRLTMRFTHLNGPEEFDNAQAWARTYFLLETGMVQIKQKIEEYTMLLASKEKDKIPKDQLDNINDFMAHFKEYDETKPIDSAKNLSTIRKHFRGYNYNIGYGVIMYDMHYALLNGRYADNGQARKDVLELTQEGVKHEKDVQVGGWNRLKFWDRDKQ